MEALTLQDGLLNADQPGSDLFPGASIGVGHHCVILCYAAGVPAQAASSAPLCFDLIVAVSWHIRHCSNCWHRPVCSETHSLHSHWYSAGRSQLDHQEDTAHTVTDL